MYGKKSPHTARIVLRLGLLRWVLGDPAAAVALLARAESVFEPYIALILGGGTEQDRRAFLEQIGAGGHVDYAVSLHLGAALRRADAAELALSLVLRRRRVLDAVSSRWTRCAAA